MHDVDGYAVARAIRGDLGLTDLPLIAMTAHVGESERQQCLEAGMNDHVSKPIDPRTLMTTISRWVAREEGPESLQTATDGPHEDRPFFLPTNIPEIDVPAAVKRLSGNETLFARLFHDFCRDYRTIADEIGTAMAAGDSDRAKRLAHTLKGVSGNLSANRVHQAARVLERAIGRVDERRLATLLSGLSEAVRATIEAGGVITEGAGVEAKEDDSGSAGEDGRSLMVLLQKLHSLVVKRNLKARQVFGALRGRLEADSTRVEANRCDEALKRLDFDAAQEHIAAIGRLLGVSPLSEEIRDEKTDDPDS